VDIKGERFYHGLVQAEDQWLTNVWFARIIIQNLETLFAPGEVNDIWIVHPDPRPKTGDEHRRLTYSRFLDIYYRLLSDGWILRLKTDDRNLRDYSVASIMADGRRELIDSTTDLHSSPLLADHYDISTRYERRGIERGRTICYGVWRKL
jgi:tRNA (guanine-N7-)-methyltransferase